MIKKLKNGYQVLSSKGKNLGGPYKTLEEAKKRLRQFREVREDEMVHRASFQEALAKLNKQVAGN
jgi:ribosome modulation factor